MNIQIINPIEYPKWDDLILTNPACTFFHTSAWAKVLYESYKYKPLYFTSLENGKLSTLIPVMEIKSYLTGNRGVSLPFTDYCHPIVSDEIDFNIIIDEFIGYGEKAGWKYVELRGGANYFQNKIPSSYYYRHRLKLEKNYQEIFATFRKSTKRNIKKAIKEGVKVEILNSFESVKEFYRLNCLTRRDHGLPPQPYTFFKKLHEHIISVKRGFVALAFYQNRAIAGNIYLHIGKKAIYKYGASNRSFQHLRANNLVMWEGIKWCAENGLKSLCFGRTDPENQGLLQFKRGWSTREETIKYYKYDLAIEAFVEDSSRIKFFNPFFQKLPLPLLKLAGHLLYRHVG